MLKWEMAQSPLGDCSFTISWSRLDLLPIDLTPFDLLLLRECEASPSGADKLLAVEMLVRKMEAVTQHERPR